MEAGELDLKRFYVKSVRKKALQADKPGREGRGRGGAEMN